MKVPGLTVMIGLLSVLFPACSEQAKGDMQDMTRGDSLADTGPETFGFGSPASAQDIKKWDIDIMPDGRGLPKGQGAAMEGKAIYLAKCAACHGNNGDEGPYDVLVSKKGKSIGTYWPYATTLFDYIRRTMPFNTPGTLTDDEVYHLTAYLLHANGIIDSAEVIDARTLPKVTMPAKALFVPDDRKGGPEVR